MSAQPESESSKLVSLTITNRHSAPIKLYVEPWGDEHEIAPNKTFRVDFRAATLQAVPISYGRDSITVEGWQGSVAEIWCDGELLN
jgi:hypothetical protein